MSIAIEAPKTTTNSGAAATQHATLDPQRDLLLSLRQGMIMLSKTGVSPEQYRAWRLMIVAIEKFTGIEK